MTTTLALFSDKRGRLWHLPTDLAAIMRLNFASIELGDLTAPIDSSAAVELWFRAIWAVCGPEVLLQRGTRRDFIEACNLAALREARERLLDALGREAKTKGVM